MNDKFLNFLGLCRRAGKMKIGCDTVIESVNLGNSHLVIMASDISENTKKTTEDKINKEIKRIREEINELTKLGISLETIIERIIK